MKRLGIIFLLLAAILAGCSSSEKQEVEKAIQVAFEARAKAVFRYQDKKPLTQYFSSKALNQTREILDWTPKGGWANVKDIKYSINLRMEKVKIDGKQASAVVYETAVVSWDWVDPDKARALQDDAWSNRKHTLTLTQDAEGKWFIEQDRITK